MRLLALAVAATLFAAGFGIAEDKKAEKPDVKKDDKMTKTDGKVTKIDGKKIMVKGDGKDAKEMTFTTDDKTKFYSDEKKEKTALKDDTKKADPKGTMIKMSDVKVGDMVTVVAGDDMLATEVWVHTAKKTEDKPKGDK